ncbi:hypothetical protein V039C_0052 [Vibrio phage V039C]|nr:hypothetical protein V039C_0052 [Vibrio phage V039C]QJD54582.1 hypothetical protein [Vibrio phage phiV039C]
MAERIEYAFGESGDLTPVPNQSVGTELSIENGWSPAYSLPPDSPGYRYLDRGQHNYLWNLATGNIKQWQDQAYPQWYGDFDYPIGAKVRHNEKNYNKQTNNDGSASEPGLSSDWVAVNELQALDDIIGGSIFKGSNGEYVQSGDNVPVGTTHLRVLIGGGAKLVSMLPDASGIVSAISGDGAMIGGTQVSFYEYSKSKYTAFDSVDQMKLAKLSVRQLVRTKGYYSPNGYGGADYIVETGTPVPRLDHDLGGGLIARFLSNDGKIRFSQCGYNPNDLSQSLTANAVAVGAKRDNLEIVFDAESGPLVDTNHQFDFGGRPINLSGNAYRFSPGNVGKIYNGFAILRDTWKGGAPNTVSKTRNIDAVYRSTPPVLGPKKRFPVEVSEADVDVGGKIFTWRKCDSSGYWIFEQIVTQQPSGLSTSIDELCPAWRLGQLSMCDFVQAYIYTPSVVAVGDSEFTLPNPGGGNQERDIKYRQTNQPAAFYEYEIKEPSEKIGILLRTSTSGCSDILAEVIDSEGNVTNQKSFSNVASVSNNLKVVYIDSCVFGEDVTLRLTQNTASTAFMSIAGVGCIVDNEVTASNIDYVTYSAYTTGDNKVRSFFSGAMDYAIMESNLLKFGGESHGGEIMSKQEIYVDGDLFTPVNGNILATRELRIEQASRTTFPSSAYFDTQSRHKFYSYPAAHDFSASHDFSDGFMARIAYGPMVTTHSQMDKMILPEVIDASADGFSGSDERYEFGKTEYVRLESSVNPFVNEMWLSSYDGNYNESTPWWKIGKNANDLRKFYYGPVSSSSCGEKDLSKQPYATRSVRIYN